MVKRVRPPSTLIAELCGNRQRLIERVHHGLAEVSLGSFYPNLNLDETIAFAAGSHWLREDESTMFSHYIDNHDIYEIFSHIFKRGFPWLNNYKNIPEEKKSKHNKLNPFNGRLRKRLERVDAESTGQLKGQLQGNVSEWVFEIQYKSRVKEKGNNIGIRSMGFQNVYPARGRIVPAYALEIARIIDRYPKNYEPLPEVSDEITQTNFEPALVTPGHLF